MAGNGRIAYPNFASGSLLHVNKMFQVENIFTCNSDGTDIRLLTTHSSACGLPSYSPDGTKIAYTAIAADGTYSIYSIDAQGTNDTLLATNAQIPSWSHHGTTIAYAGLSVAGQWEIFTMNAGDGTNKIQITNSPSIPKIAACWSPDDSKIVYSQVALTATTSHVGLFIMNADGTNNIALTTGTWNNLDLNGNIINTANDANAAAWDTVSGKIAFWSGIEHNQGQIWTINPDGTGRTQLTHNLYPFHTDEPAWSPDGNWILYTTDTSTKPQVWMMDRAGNNQHVVANSIVSPITGRAAWQPVP